MRLGNNTDGHFVVHKRPEPDLHTLQVGPFTRIYPAGSPFAMHTVDPDTNQDITSPTSAKTATTTGDKEGEETHDESLLQAIRAAAPSQPSQLATGIALEGASHQRLPSRSFSPSTVPSSSGTSSSLGSRSRQESYDDGQSTATESAEEEEVEFITEPTPVPSDIDTASVAESRRGGDSSKHFGNGVTCRYYNKSRCAKGNTCPYSHASDLYSLRSHPEGRNVCIYFIHNNKCRFKDQQCNYSHNRADLLWNDEEIAEKLEEKLTERKNDLNAKKEEKRAMKTRKYHPSTSSPKRPVPEHLPTISEPLVEVTLPTHPSVKSNQPKGRKPNKKGPSTAGVNMYPARWDLPQQVDRLQLLRFGLLTYEGQQPRYYPTPYIPYNPLNGYPIG